MRCESGVSSVAMRIEDARVRVKSRTAIRLWGWYFRDLPVTWGGGEKQVCKQLLEVGV